MREKYSLNKGYSIEFETPDDGFSYFFGYYDKCPLSKDNSRLLAHRVSFDGRAVDKGDVAGVGYFELRTGKFVEIDKTLAWNWQQGAQLQWIPCCNDQKVIYNSVIAGKYVSILFDIEEQTRRIIDFPIYAIHPSGKEALGVNYDRHYWCRPGYNYQQVVNKKFNCPYHPEDGIFKIDLQSGNVRRIVDICEIVKKQYLDEFEVSNSWLEHIMYNPSGTRFMFFHRWRYNNVDHTRLYTANSIDGNGLYLYPDNRFYSHSSWKNNQELTIWTKFSNKRKQLAVKKNEVLKKILKPVYVHLMKPFLSNKMQRKVSILSSFVNFCDEVGDYCIIGEELALNGHTTWSSDKRLLLNDSYQDQDGYRRLELYDTEKRKIKKIGEFYSEYNDVIYRADLHPRFSIDLKSVIIDSAHEKKRKILIIKC